MVELVALIEIELNASQIYNVVKLLIQNNLNEIASIFIPNYVVQLKHELDDFLYAELLSQAIVYDNVDILKLLYFQSDYMFTFRQCILQHGNRCLEWLVSEMTGEHYPLLAIEKQNIEACKILKQKGIFTYDRNFDRALYKTNNVELYKLFKSFDPYLYRHSLPIYLELIKEQTSIDLLLRYDIYGVVFDYIANRSPEFIFQLIQTTASMEIIAFRDFVINKTVKVRQWAEQNSPDVVRLLDEVGYVFKITA